jgi:glycosyltransferase involved in cell wall biosynthesis
VYLPRQLQAAISRTTQIDSSRILLVAPFPAWQWVSINRYAANLQRALADGGHDSAQAFMPWFNPPSALYGLRTNYRKRSPALAEHGRHPFDVVHITDHALGHHVASLGKRAAVVVTCHDLMPFYEPKYYSMPLRPLKKALIAHSVDKMAAADHLIAVSKATKVRMVEHLGIAPERISVVPNMLRDGLAPLPDARERLEASGLILPPGPLVLSVGHAGYYKNIELLLKAMASAELRHASLLRVGARLSGAQRSLANRLGIEERIIELGRVPAATLRAVYSVASVLAMPSRDEGFGIPIIEAMACGLPVIASDGGALPEVVADAGIIVPLQESPAQEFEPAQRFARAIVSVLESSDRACELRLAGIRRAELFRPPAVLPQIQEAYAIAAAARSVSNPG